MRWPWTRGNVGPLAGSADAGQRTPRDAWCFYESLGEKKRSRLGEVEQAVAAICDLRQEVQSGGFDRYFRYLGGNTALKALAALPIVLGQEWADVLSEAMALLGAEYPLDMDIRADLVDRADATDQFDQLDEGLYGLEATVDADALLTAYLNGPG